ncbi:MAG: Wzz/FepE/Etk N-terminal domain-containing protein, partial [Flavobacteriales bacterium]
MVGEDISQRNLNFESYKERITNFSNEFELGLFLYIVKRSTFWILLCILSALAAAFIYLRYTAPIYEARTIIQLRESNTAQQVLSMNAFAEEDNNLQADVELMRSKFFVGMAMKRMDLEVSYYNRGQILTEDLYKRNFFKLKELTVLDETVRDQPVFIDLTIPGKLKLSYTLGGKPYDLEFVRGQVVRTPHFSCLIELNDPALTLDADMRGSLYFRINSPSALVNRFASNISVNIAEQNAKTVTISGKDENSHLARDLAQVMAETFI